MTTLLGSILIAALFLAPDPTAPKSPHPDGPVIAVLLHENQRSVEIAASDGNRLLLDVQGGKTWSLRADLRSVRLRLYRLLRSEQLAMRLLDIGLRSVRVGIDRARREEVESAPRGPSAGLAADLDALFPDASSAPPAAPDAVDRPPERTG